MMLNQRQDQTFVIVCDETGVIQRILRNDFHHHLPLERGHPLLHIFETGSAEKAAQFLSELQKYGVAQNWEIDVTAGEDICTFQFQGMRVEDLLYIAGNCTLKSDTGDGFPPGLNSNLYNELSRLNNEIVNTQRALMKAQGELKKERDLLSVTLKSIQDAIIATDQRGQITLVNSIAEMLLGKTFSELRGKLLKHSFAIVEDEARDSLFSVLENGVVSTPIIEATITNHKGTHIPIEAIGASLVDENGSSKGFVLSFRDITYRKMVEAEQARLLSEARKARAEAEQANAQRLRFMAMVTHELRSPLTSIRGFSSTLLSTDVSWDEATQREFIQTIDAEAIRLTELIDQLLQVSEIEASALKIQLEQTSIEEIVTYLKPQLQMISTDHPLSVEVPASISPIWADRRRIAQVFNNLVSNAAKYSPPLSEIQIRITELPGFVKVMISDEGPGIPVEERERVFELFHRLKRDVSKKKGTGLGLAICKGLIEAHGGRIWIEDSLRGGTTVSFTLPIHEAQHEERLLPNST